jgi:hypothetical protein
MMTSAVMGLYMFERILSSKAVDMEKAAQEKAH